MATLALLVAPGCGKSDRLDIALRGSGQSRTAVCPFAGKVRIDGEEPKSKLKARQELVVMLNDPANPDAPISQRLYTIAGPDGKFAFYTYTSDDGIPPGKYVVTFAVLKQHGKSGFLGPDALQNLYNDPDKNADVKEFVIDHKPPGSRNYDFDLMIAGRDPATPGPHSLINLGDPYFSGRKGAK